MAVETLIFAPMLSFKKIFLLLWLIASFLFAMAQSDTIANPESTRVIKPSVKPIRRDTTTRNVTHRLTKDLLSTKDTNEPIKDSSRMKDSVLLVQKKVDSTRLDSIRKSLVLLANKKDTSTYGSAFGGAYIPINLPSVALLEKERNPQGKDELFYLLVGLTALVAFTKVVFPRYFTNIFSLFFQTSHRQKHAIEQINNSKISSLLLNIAFVTGFAIYISIILDSKGILHSKQWMLLLYSLAAITSIYLFKFVFLNFLGWAFNAQEAMESYTFVVFISNKIAAIVLIPFLFILAFNDGQVAAICLTATYCLFGLVLLYRYFVAIGTLRNELHLQALHFFLYLCAAETLPLVLIYKVVFNLITTSI